MVGPALERQTERELVIAGQRYRLASDEQARQVGERRAYDPQWIPRQNVDPRVEFEIPLTTFHVGYGYSFAEQPGFYERADGWDATAPGKLTTWGRLTTCESFASVATRGHLFEFGGYAYAFRGEYAVKYQPQEGDAVWPIVERHYFGANARISGPPVVHEGYLYVPLHGLTIDTAERWQRLTTVANTAVEVQTITEGGTPTGGTFTLTFADGITTTTTAALAYNISAAAMQTALRLIPGLEKVTVTRSGAGPANFVWTVTMTGAPAVLAGTSPPQFTASAAGLTPSGTITPATSVAGTGDRWDRGPTGAEANHFAFYDGKLTRALGHEVASADADPTLLASWGTAYAVGDETRRITQLGVFERFLVPCKEDGVWTFDNTATSIQEPLGIEHVIDEKCGVGLATAHAFMFIPHRTGLIRWRPGGPYAYIGAEQDGQFDGDLSPGWGRIEAIAQYGKTLYFTANDTHSDKGVIGSFLPGGGERGPYTPHMHHLGDAALEDIKVISYQSEPVTSHFPQTVVNDATVGTLDWSGLTNIGADDSSYATVATSGTTRYLKASGYNFQVPLSATIEGILALVRRKGSGGTVATTIDYSGAPVDYVVPAGVTALTVDIMGAQGGTSDAGDSGTGGRGARVQTTLTVTPGETLKVRAGGTATSPSVGLKPSVGGYNGGGSGGGGSGLGGGGASDIRRSGDALVNRVVVAAGGGGAGVEGLAAGGNSPAGGRGSEPTGGTGDSGTAPGLSNTGGGGGGTQSAGGGGPGDGQNGALGTGGEGGNGASNVYRQGGGGGGGYYGGGGGQEGVISPDVGPSGGGGGGSSYASATLTSGTTHTAGYREGNGRVVLSYASGTYIDDASVKIVKGGTIGGNEKAYATAWAADEATFAYGGPTDLWGQTWTPADINSADFGVAFAALLSGSGITASVNYVALQVYYTLPGGTEAVPFLVALTTDADRTTCTPYVYDLPHHGQTVSNEPSVAKAAAGKDFYTSRYSLPMRSVQKTYRSCEIWLEMVHEYATPGLVVLASVNDRPEFRLELADGSTVIREQGFHELFFPPTADAVGDYVQLHFQVPEATADEEPVYVTIREATLRGLYRSLRTEVAHAVLLLEQGQEFAEGGYDGRTVKQQMSDLLYISARGSAPAELQDPFGEDSYCHIPMPAFREFAYREGEPERVAAIVDIRKVPYR